MEGKKLLFRAMLDGGLKPDGPLMLWKLNRSCNFRCAYCFCSARELAHEHPLCGRESPERVARRFDETGREWTILMTGGEPFLYPGFIALCRSLSRRHRLAMNTNLSLPAASRFAGEVDPRRVALVNAAFHAAELERTGRKAAFLKHVRLLQDGGFPVCVEYVAYPPLFDRLDADLRELEETGVRFAGLKVFRGTHGGRAYPRAYSAAQKDVFIRRGLDDREPDFIDKRFSFPGRPCRAGREFFFMDIAGGLRRCPGSAKSYGNFFSGRFRPDRTPRPCPFPRCFSPWVGRDFAGGRKSSPLATLEEAVREGIPFLLNGARLRGAWQSLRNHLRP